MSGDHQMEPETPHIPEEIKGESEVETQQQRAAPETPHNTHPYEEVKRLRRA